MQILSCMLWTVFSLCWCPLKHKFLILTKHCLSVFFYCLRFWCHLRNHCLIHGHKGVSLFIYLFIYLFIFNILFIYLFIYLFTAVLGLRFCVRAFSSCGKWGPFFIAVRRPLTIVASLVAEHRLQTRRLSNCGSRAQSLRGMWDLPRPGLEPVSPALAGRLSTTVPPGKPPIYFFKRFIVIALTFKSLIPFELIFVYGVRSNFILLLVNIELSQHF